MLDANIQLIRFLKLLGTTFLYYKNIVIFNCLIYVKQIANSLYGAHFLFETYRKWILTALRVKKSNFLTNTYIIQWRLRIFASKLFLSLPCVKTTPLKNDGWINIFRPICHRETKRVAEGNYGFSTRRTHPLVKCLWTFSKSVLHFKELSKLPRWNNLSELLECAGSFQ